MSRMAYTPGFYLHLRQDGDGCGYTIGCGHSLMRLKAATPEDARVEAMAEWQCADTSDQRVDRAILLTVTEAEDLAPAILAARVQREGELRETAMRRKRADLERLKRELGEP